MLKESIQESINLRKTLLEKPDFTEKTEQAINLLINCFKNGNKVLRRNGIITPKTEEPFAAEILFKFWFQAKCRIISFAC